MLRRFTLLAVLLLLAATALAQKHVVFVIGEREYDTKRTLPMLAGEHLKGEYRSTFVHASSERPNRFDGLVTALATANVVVLSVRRRAPSKRQLDAFRAFLARGGALVAVRTSSHAFDAKGEVPEGHATWRTFDKDVLGCRYTGHHGKKQRTRVWIDLTHSQHPILYGAPRNEAAVGSTLYRSAPLDASVTPLLHGRSGGHPTQPVAWIRTRKDGGRVFYTSLGHAQDFATSWFPRLLVRAIRWAAKDPVDGPKTTAPLAPEAAHATLRTPDDLAVDLVLHEPIVQQPVFLNFDARGRLWVVQYRQYPHPAGLKITSRDRIWRNVYDKVPPPPPHAKDSPFRGADRITIHADTDGDGVMDRHKVFVDGLNMCTACAHGRGGVWVLNPPYLLFYPDANRDDVPDGKPTVHLEGFGLEDSHSLVNSLRWGPDGWLYGAQGSTVTARVRVTGTNDPPIHTQGQQIWRYHPERRAFEVFAEGGGNAFGCEIDAQGRVFSGHNGGDTRGFHYPQGGYLRKGFHKHGPLSNPYAFGFFPHMPHARVARFTHNFIVYEGRTLPFPYHNKIFAIDPLHRHVPIVRRLADGATFRTEDTGYALRTNDTWFRPVDIKHGPDGAIYICDWYDSNVNHYRNHEGRIDKQRGRIYRIRGVDHPKLAPVDLGTATTDQLLATLGHKNRWFRATARRVLADRRALADRRNRAARDALRKTPLGIGQIALERLWTRHLLGDFDTALQKEGLASRNPYVRAWTVRLLGDQKDANIAAPIREQLFELARWENSPEVRSQLAATAKRLSTQLGLAIFSGLTQRDLDRKDRYIPLQLWWALESKCATDPAAVLALFESPNPWGRPIFREHLLARLMRRFAAAGTHEDLLHCARLLELAPSRTAKQILMNGFEQAFRGRSVAGLPDELVRAIEASGTTSPLLDVRRGDATAIAKALATIADRTQPFERRTAYIELLAELRNTKVVRYLFARLKDGRDRALHATALHALARFDDPAIGRTVVARFPKLTGAAADAARSLLASRAAWTRQLLAAIRSDSIDAGSFPAEDVALLRLHEAEDIQNAIDAIFGKSLTPYTEALRKEVTRVRAALTGKLGDPYKGKQLFAARCASCHKLFADGGQLGPDLTTYQRTDLDALLLAIIDPNAEIRAGYERFVATTKDDRIVVGAKVEATDKVVVLRNLDGKKETLERRNLTSLEPAQGSLMPAGLLTGLSDAQLRDLFAYLRTTQPQIK